MPNWCDTQIVIYSKNKSVIHLLHAKVKSFMTAPAYKGLSDNTRWIGNILCHSGYDYTDVCNGKYGYTRGWINNLNDVEDNADTGYSSFFLDQEDAWCAIIEPWRHIITKLYPYHDIKISWIAEEPGCDVYQKYDPDGLFFCDREYCVDCYVDSSEAWKEYPELMDEHRGFSLTELKTIFKLDTIEAITARAEEIEEEMQEKYGEGFYHINKYEEMDSEF